MIDKTTATGELMVTVLTCIADFEADMIKERQMELLLQRKEAFIKGNRKNIQKVIKDYNTSLNS